MMRLITLLLAATLALSGCRDASDADAAAIETQYVGLTKVLDDTDAAIAADDMDRLYALSTPPEMVDAILRSQGLTTEAQMQAARSMMETMAKSMLEQADITSHTMDRAAIRYETGTNGATVAFVPMSMTMTMMGQTVQTSGEYVALERNDRWFLLSPSDPNITKAMAGAFPELAGLSITPMTTTMTPED